MIYSIVVIPLTAVRFKTDFGLKNNLPPIATFVVIFIYSLSGFFNALLFLLTRKDLLFMESPDLKRKVGVAPGAEEPVGAVQPSSDEELGGEKNENRTKMEDSNHLAPSILIGSGSDGGWEPHVTEENGSKEILTIPR